MTEKRKGFKIRAVAVLLIAVMVISMAGCGGTKTSEEKTSISVYLWGTGILDQYARYIQSQLPDLELEFVVGNNDLDYYKFMAQNDALPDIITNRRFSLHDAAELQNQLMDLSNTDTAASYYTTYLENYRNADGTINWLPVCGEVDTVLINKALFDKYDIPIPTDYDSFVSACREFEKHGIKGFVSDYDYDYTCMELLQGWSISELTSLKGQMWRMEYENPSGKGVGLDDEVWPGVFERMEQFIKDVGISAEEAVFGYDQVYRAFSEGRAAMIRDTGTAINTCSGFEGVEPMLIPYYSQDGEGWLLTYPAFQIAMNKKLETDGRKKDAMRVLQVMLSEDAQNILAAGQDVISYKKDVELKLRDEMENLKPYVDANHLYIRLASNDFFAVSRDVVQKMISGEYNASQAYAAFNEQIKEEKVDSETNTVTVNASYPRGFKKDGGNKAASAMAGSLREMYDADVLITPAYNLCGPVTEGEYSEKMIGYMVMPNAMVTGISREMTGRQVKELVRCLVEGDKGVMKPFNLGTLPVVSGMSIEVSQSDEGYILKEVKMGDKAVADDAVYKVAYTNPAGFYNDLMNNFTDDNGDTLFEIQETRTRGAWVEYMKRGGQIAEPEDYITVK